MSIFEKSRFEIWNPMQHPYKHTLNDFAYSHPSTPWVTTLEGALNSIMAVNYPNTKEAVATPADLPTGTDIPNAGDVTPDPLDYRVVIDDGDGKGAGYRWEQREGDLAPMWYKIYDMDWGEETILSNFLTKTNDTYVSKFGQDEVDENGDVVTGDMAGQYIYGGSSANTNLTLFANSGDGTDPATGFVQIGDQLRALTDAAFDIGTATKRFRDLRLSGDIYTGTLAMIGDVLTSSTGKFDFSDDNIETTGKVTALRAQLEESAVMKQISTPVSPAAGYDKLYFKADDKLYRMTSAGAEKLVGLEFTSTNDNRLVRSDGSTGGAIQESGITVSDLDEITGITSLTVDNMTLDGDVISSIGNLYLTPANKVILPSLRNTGLTNDRVAVPRADGTMTSTGVVITAANEIIASNGGTLGNLSLAGETLSSAGNLVLNAGSAIYAADDLLSLSDRGNSLGSATFRFSDLFLSPTGQISDGTNSFPIEELMKLKDASLGANAGDSLFYDGSKWIPSAPDSEIDHGSISGLLDDDHTQYAILAGRTSGQTLIGGEDAGANLVLGSTSNVSKGSIFVQDKVVATADDSVDLGTGASRFKDIYQSGELKGSRLENVTNATLPSSSAAQVGRAVFNTETKQLMIDTGIKWVSEGINRHVADLSFDGIVTSRNVDVSADVIDARNCQIQLLNNNNDFDRIYCPIKAISATTIRIETNTPLPAGSYRLVVIE